MSINLRNFKHKYENHILAGSTWIKHGDDCLPTALIAQHANVTSSESDCGKYVIVLIRPCDVIRDPST